MLGRQLQQRFGKLSLVADLSDFDPETIGELPKTALVAFILSTYGDGDPSDNASPFWEHLTRAVHMPNMQYVAFGLGNSQYKHYNRVVDVVDNALSHIGATRLAQVGKADDASNSTQEDFATWRDDVLFQMLREDRGWTEQTVKYEPELSVVEDGSMEPTDLYVEEPVHASKSQASTTESSPIREIQVKSTQTLFSTTNRSCIHVNLDLTSHSQLAYKTGDHLAIWAPNPEDEVRRLLSILGAEYTRERQHMPIHVKLTPGQEAFGKIPVPSPTTIDALFRRYLEICAPVSRDTVRNLAEFAPSAASKSFLLSLGSDKRLFAELHATAYINLARLLELAAAEDKSNEHNYWGKLPLSFIIEALPVMQPRFYSISSSSVISPRTPSITVGIADTQLPSGQVIPGLATNYLAASALTEQSSVYAHIRRSKFKLPTMSSTPLVMVAAGTGLAPFIAFVNERLRMQSVGREIGQMILFFGCRAPDEDYIYNSEMEDLQHKLKGKLEVTTAFSRIEGGCYVQDKIKEAREEVMAMLESGANLYICGRASMAREVGKVMSDAAKEMQSPGQDGANQWTESLKKSRKWQEDVWG